MTGRDTTGALFDHVPRGLAPHFVTLLPRSFPAVGGGDA